MLRVAESCGEPPKGRSVRILENAKNRPIAGGGHVVVHATSLVAVYGEDIPATERVELTADVGVAGRPDVRLQKFVSRIGLEAGAFAVGWRIVPTSDDERELLPEA